MNKTRIISLVLFLCLLIVLSGCGSKEKSNDISKENASGFSSYTTDEECFTVETKYGKLEYPKKWEQITKTEIFDKDIYTVKFFCVSSNGKIPLFNMNFNGGKGFYLGDLPTGGQNIPVYLDSFEIDRGIMTEEEYNNCRDMEEDVNVIISRLIEKNGMRMSTDKKNHFESTKESTSVYSIKTKYGKLSYPEKWKEIVKIEVVDAPVYTVKFSTETTAGKIPLFDLTYNGGNGYCLGKMTVDGQTVTIYTNDYKIDKDNMNEEEYNNCCAMCEDVNVILEHLAKDYGFTFQ